jgi:hypothetical protein
VRRSVGGCNSILNDGAKHLASGCDATQNTGAETTRDVENLLVSVEPIVFLLDARPAVILVPAPLFNFIIQILLLKRKPLPRPPAEQIHGPRH